MTYSCVCSNNARDIFQLTKRPLLHKQWVDTIVDYIHEQYGNPLANVDAIVDPDTRGFVSAVIVASRLQLPYIPIHKAGMIPADPEDVIQATYLSPKNKVNTLQDFALLHFLYSL